jgi:hypothetical protein
MWLLMGSRSWAGWRHAKCIIDWQTFWTANILRLEGKRINLAFVYHTAYPIRTVTDRASCSLRGDSIECYRSTRNSSRCIVTFLLAGSGDTSLAEWGRIKAGKVYETSNGEVQRKESPCIGELDYVAVIICVFRESLHQLCCSSSLQTAHPCHTTTLQLQLQHAAATTTLLLSFALLPLPPTNTRLVRITASGKHTHFPLLLLSMDNDLGFGYGHRRKVTSTSTSTSARQRRLVKISS